MMPVSGSEKPWILCNGPDTVCSHRNYTELRQICSPRIKQTRPRSSSPSNEQSKLRGNNERDPWNSGLPRVWRDSEPLWGNHRRRTECCLPSLAGLRRVSILRTSGKQKLYWSSCVETLSDNCVCILHIDNSACASPDGAASDIRPSGKRHGSFRCSCP